MACVIDLRQFKRLAAPKAGGTMRSISHEVTQLLLAWNDGDQTALDKLAPLVERELHRLAQHYLHHERPGHSMQAADLVNEAYLRLIDWQSVEWQNRAHFFGMAARLMRRILGDHARRRHLQKRGGGAFRVSLTQVENMAQERSLEVIALDDALNTLAQFDERKSH